VRVVMVVMLVLVRFGFRGVWVIMTATVLMIFAMLVRVWLWVGETHVVSLEPRLHLDKANFSLTASPDKGN
jgi:hypothetical protein